MTSKTVLMILISLTSFALMGCGDNDSTTAPTLVVDTVAPAVPAGVTIAAYSDHVDITWDENAEPDLAGYVLERSFDRESWTQMASGLLVSSQYVDSKYNEASYRVAAQDASANVSAYSGSHGYGYSSHDPPKFPSKPQGAGL